MTQIDYMLGGRYGPERGQSRLDRDLSQIRFRLREEAVFDIDNRYVMDDYVMEKRL